MTPYFGRIDAFTFLDLGRLRRARAHSRPDGLRIERQGWAANRHAHLADADLVFGDDGSA